MTRPFFQGPSVRLFDFEGRLRVHGDDNVVKATVDPATLLDATSAGGELRLEGSFKEIRIGRLRDRDALYAAKAIAMRYSLPKPLQYVTEEELKRYPNAFHGRHLEITARWTSTFELSSFAGAWLTGGPHLRYRDEHGRGEGWVRARGIWLSERGKPSTFEAYLAVELPEGIKQSSEPLRACRP